MVNWFSNPSIVCLDCLPLHDCTVFLLGELVFILPHSARTLKKKKKIGPCQFKSRVFAVRNQLVWIFFETNNCKYRDILESGKPGIQSWLCYLKTGLLYIYPPVDQTFIFQVGTSTLKLMWKLKRGYSQSLVSCTHCNYYLGIYGLSMEHSLSLSFSSCSFPPTPYWSWLLLSRSPVPKKEQYGP